MRLRSLPMPEAGAEVRTVLLVHHNCHMARALKGNTEVSEDIDQVMFAVGAFGSGMPPGVPFECVSNEACAACGKLLRAMFQWTAPTRIFLG